MEQEVKLRTEHELNASLDKMAGELKLILNNQKSIANGLTRVPAVSQFANTVLSNKNSNVYNKRAINLEQFFLNYQHSVPSIQALRFIDTSGKSLVKVKEGKPIEAKKFDVKNKRYYVADQSPKDFFKEAIKSAHQGKVVISDFELGQVTFGADFCPSMVRYSVPVRDELDQLQGLLVVNMWGTRLDSAVKSTMDGYPANSYIVEINKNKLRDGIYLYHPDSKKRFANQLNTNFRFTNEVTTDEWKEMKFIESYGSIFHPDGRMFFYKTISPFQNRDTKWLLLIEASSKKIFESVNNMRRSIWLLVGTLVIVSLLLAVWASGRLTRPVHRLAEIIHKFADGERGVRYQGEENDEVGSAGKAFNYLTTTLEQTEKEREKAVRAACQSERLAALGQMAAGIGHEINNPLMNIMSLATLIEEALGEGHDAAKNDITLLRKEGQRCARIIQGILNFARENEPCYKPFNLSELICETLELLHHRIESSDINLVTNIENELMMEGDAGMLQQVLVNVLLNAIQASSVNAEIVINAKNKDEKLIIEIIDQGTGIQGNDFSKIFDPFFTTKSEGEGTGLGLSVSYGIIKHHGGTISIDNMKDAGVKVRITLPVKCKIENKELDYLEAKNVG
ncbi:MAG: sensor histidine kinase [Gammaproteobacteria bacterium]|nr:sensor histidine kinase [Gammaproteobacteria bacterium]